ncbi:Uma2 family endonuclease [Nocardiopsis sp. RSe5-2]|uniref:Uma2 family endonuclease n=1 Tax=Nocardiopsis endophytica TaxID=3018445 RepID=A0ABT4U7A7_9ACTN|nr:Uma2 family endonuclease [Nocardiopsis endophytica]MDA2812829.1 Uma2 family endonuclease [Nocardiopsis endophytica]
MLEEVAATMGAERTGRGWLTVDDLARMPDEDGIHELDDGRLDVSPTPGFDHARVVARLLGHLGRAAPDGFEVLTRPGVNIHGDPSRHRRPDLAVIRDGDVTGPYLARPPLLAVEVLSPESTIRDTHRKRAEYAESGIESYWIIAPSAERTAVFEMRLDHGAYRDVQEVLDTDVFETEVPFPLRLVPRWLTADGPWRRCIGGEEAGDRAERSAETQETPEDG